MKVITVVSDTDNPGFKHLERSLKHHGYELDVLRHPFKFGGQMQHVYEWCKANWGTFIYTDGWDTFALAGPEEVQGKFAMYDCEILISAEKNCYPLKTIQDLYPVTKHEWRFVNGGGFMGDCAAFCKMYEDGTINQTHEQNDQQWLAEQYIRSLEVDTDNYPRRNDVRIAVDTDCQIFQTIAFEGDDDFGRRIIPADKYCNGWKDEIRLVNKKTATSPCFIHGNAHTPMNKVWILR